MRGEGGHTYKLPTQGKLALNRVDPPFCTVRCRIYIHKQNRESVLVSYNPQLIVVGQNSRGLRCTLNRDFFMAARKQISLVEHGMYGTSLRLIGASFVEFP